MMRRRHDGSASAGRGLPGSARQPLADDQGNSSRLAHPARVFAPESGD